MDMKSIYIAAAVFGLSAVMLGAFGAHALKDKITPEKLASYETGVRYQIIHAVVLLVVALLLGQADSSLLRWSGHLMVTGVVLFSFSIYLLALRDMLGIASWRWLGPVTPAGGLCLIAGWLTLLIWAIKLKV